MDPSAIDPGLLRLLDAAANRCREGLRVIEDIARFLWNDEDLVRDAKDLRHECTAAVQRLEAATGPLIAMRDTDGDVGTALTTVSELERPNVASLLRANAARVQEALRSLEEAAKLAGSSSSSEFKQLRYRAYTFEVDALRRQGIIVPVMEESIDG